MQFFVASCRMICVVHILNHFIKGAVSSYFAIFPEVRAGCAGDIHIFLSIDRKKQYIPKEISKQINKQVTDM